MSAILYLISDWFDKTQRSPIFQLDLDCLDEVFDWLTIADLHSFGQTCKRFHRAASLYFNKTHKTFFNQVITAPNKDNPNFNRPMNGFREFVENITFDYDFEDNWPYKYVRSNYKNQLKSVVFKLSRLTAKKLNYIKNSLETVDTIQLRDVKISGEQYTNLLSFCPDLKKLIHQNVECDHNNWLLNEYQNLEHFGFFQRAHVAPNVIELRTFFNQNRQIKIVETDSITFCAHWKSFINNDLELDEFRLHLNSRYGAHGNIELNELYTKGFYKRLHLACPQDDEMLPSIPALTSIYVNYVTSAISTLLMLEHLYLGPSVRVCHVNEMNMLAQGLIHLKKVFFYHIREVCQIRAFILYSPELREISIGDISGGFKIVNGLDLVSNNQIDLVSLNNERMNLVGARKLAIILDDKDYIETKWANPSTNFAFVELKRMKQPFLNDRMNESLQLER